MNTGAEVTTTDSTISFNSNGHTVGVDNGFQRVNFKGTVPYNYASWTFRKAEKFFDVVTYTGNGSTTYAHNLLNAFLLLVLYKATSTTSSWLACTRKNDGSYVVNILNGTTGTIFSYADADAMGLTETTFNPNPTGASGVGTEYVAYLFASDAGGFGDDGSENIIKCGSYTGNGSTDGPEIDLGFEPQFVMVKAASRTGHWFLLDVMRGIITGPSSNSPGSNQYLLANSSGAEGTTTSINVNSTGFQPRTADDAVNENAATYIYIAIRRPMKTPESGTEVFTPTFGTGSGFNFIAGFPVDMAIIKDKDGVVTPYASARLNSGTLLSTASTAAELANAPAVFDSQVGYYESSLGSNYIGWMLKRATGFFDVVAYTGDGGTTQTLNHNLGVTPEFMIAKRRNGTQNWVVYHSLVGAGKYYNLNTTSGASTLSTVWGGVEPTSTQFTVGNATTVNFNGDTYISYPFATLAGVSKVGSYTGTGSNVDVDCGFSAGARFILIKRSDSTGDWYVYDSERGIVAGNDPYLLLNSTAAEVTNTDYIDPLSSGFTVTSSAPAGLNASGGTYIFLAIA